MSPDQLDPHTTTAYFSFEVLENVYDTLVEPDENLQMQPVARTVVGESYHLALACGGVLAKSPLTASG